MCLKHLKVSLHDPVYRYPSISTGTRVLNKHQCPYRTLDTDTQKSVPVPRYRYPKPSTDTQVTSSDTHCTRKVETAGKCSQRLQTFLSGHQRLDTQLGP
ncbi:hypothetical protein GQ457_05G012970 [Hibiscus cannabinus]